MKSSGPSFQPSVPIQYASNGSQSFVQRILRPTATNRSINPTSLKRQLAPIHNLFEIARTEWGLPIKENPVAALRFKAKDQRRERRLREGELEKLISAATKRRQTDMIAAINLAIETGMRRGELLRMTKKTASSLYPLGTGMTLAW
jgi:integrase